MKKICIIEDYGDGYNCTTCKRLFDWREFVLMPCTNHKKNPSDGGDLVSTEVDSRDGDTVGDDRKSSK